MTETLQKVREVVDTYRSAVETRRGTAEVEAHIAECDRCKAGFLCETANEIIEETL